MCQKNTYIVQFYLHKTQKLCKLINGERTSETAAFGGWDLITGKGHVGGV